MADPQLRCSIQYRGTDPIGTAGDYDAYVLVEVPLPWPSEITDHPLLGETVAAINQLGIGARCRVLGLVPAAARPGHEVIDPEAPHRVVVYRRPPGPFRAFVSDERVVEREQISGTVHELLSVDVEGFTESAGHVASEVLLCTHGTRDRCCGSFGMTLFGSVVDTPAVHGARAWRVSHTGGHRFAPTAIVLPHGDMWAWLDDELVDVIVHRTRPPAELVGHYRGSSAIGSPPVQVVERELLARTGWTWLDHGRSGRELGRDGDLVRVRIEHVDPDGRPGAWEAVVERTDTVAQPVCGEPIDAAKKADDLWSLVELVDAPVLDPVPS